MSNIPDTILNRFLRYVAIDTQSDPDSTTIPSTAKQTKFLQLLADELYTIGLTDIRLADDCLTATLEASNNAPAHQPIIGLIAHVDTSPDMRGQNVKPLIHKDYDGGEIRLSPHYILSPAEFPELLHFKGHTLITSSGDTLLGADDKAGVAEIVTLAEHLKAHPEIIHGKIRLAFTTDEEIGLGADHFDVPAFGAHFAYTIDSGGIGLLEYQNFNAAQALVTITGKNIHPGYAYQKMVNALELAHQLHAALPPQEKPELTKDLEGFYMLHDLSGNVERAQMKYILREFNASQFDEMKQTLHKIAERINSFAGYHAVNVEITDQYRNMWEVMQSHPEVIERARQAYLAIGVEPLEWPIRGGTDGARLSFMGLPCPNIFTGGMNFHSRFEYASLDAMTLAVRALVALVR